MHSPDANLTDVEFGDKLERIQGNAFYNCRSLRTVTMPSVRTIGKEAFYDCYVLSDVECGEDLETIEQAAFDYCEI